MTVVIAGAASGFIMALVFATAGVMMLFTVAKNPSPEIKPVFAKFSPKTLALSMVTVGYPIWGIIGSLIGLIYKISTEHVPGAGLGSPNMVFTLAIVVVAVVMAAPFFLLFKRLSVGLLIITLSFIGVFGWFLPYFTG